MGNFAKVSIGALHSEITRAEMMLRYHLLPNDEIIRHTIVVQDVSGCLKPKHQLTKNGKHYEKIHQRFMSS